MATPAAQQPGGQAQRDGGVEAEHAEPGPRPERGRVRPRAGDREAGRAGQVLADLIRQASRQEAAPGNVLRILGGAGLLRLAQATVRHALRPRADVP